MERVSRIDRRSWSSIRLPRRVMPSRSAAQYPKHAVHKQAVIDCGAVHMFRAPWEKILDPHPLQITQFITAR